MMHLQGPYCLAHRRQLLQQPIAMVPERVLSLLLLGERHRFSP